MSNNQRQPYFATGRQLPTYNCFLHLILGREKEAELISLHGKGSGLVLGTMYNKYLTDCENARLATEKQLGMKI